MITSEGEIKYAAQPRADVDQTLIEIARFNVRRAETLKVEVKVADQNLDQFAVLGQIDGGTVHTLFNATTDFTAPDENSLVRMSYKFTTATGLAAADDDLTTTAAGETALLKLNVEDYDLIIIKAACAADNGSTTTYGSAQ